LANRGGLRNPRIDGLTSRRRCVVTPRELTNPQTRMIYVPARENVRGAIEGQERGRLRCWQGLHRRFVRWSCRVGDVQASNVDTGEKVWTHKFEKSPKLGSDAHQRFPRSARSTRKTATSVSLCCPEGAAMRMAWMAQSSGLRAGFLPCPKAARSGCSRWS